MKTRSGFVSNSSSSSFVLIGIKTDDSSKEYKHIQELFFTDKETMDSPYDWEYPDGIDYLSDEGYEYFGHLLATLDDGYLDNMNFSTDDLKNMFSEVAEALELPYDKINLYFGTRCC